MVRKQIEDTLRKKQEQKLLRTEPVPLARIPDEVRRPQVAERSETLKKDLEAPKYKADEKQQSIEKMEAAIEQKTELAGPQIKEHYGKWHWKPVEYKGGQGFKYLAGTAEKQGEILAVAVAVPGKYSQTPPSNLRGFCGYMDGYWVLAQNAKTGKRLDI